jgi:hypothetical protein
MEQEPHRMQEPKEQESPFYHNAGDITLRGLRRTTATGTRYPRGLPVTVEGLRLGALPALDAVDEMNRIRKLGPRR